MTVIAFLKRDPLNDLLRQQQHIIELCYFYVIDLAELQLEMMGIRR